MAKMTGSGGLRFETEGPVSPRTTTEIATARGPSSKAVFRIAGETGALEALGDESEGVAKRQIL